MVEWGYYESYALYKMVFSIPIIQKMSRVLYGFCQELEMRAK